MAPTPVRGAGSAEATFKFAAQSKSADGVSASMEELLAGLKSMLSTAPVADSKLLKLPISNELSDKTSEPPPIALWRRRTPSNRFTSWHATVRALAGAVTSELRPPQRCQMTVIGLGLTGLAVGGSFSQAGVPCALLEKTSAIGGVWRWYGNPFSRVNSTEPGYRLPVIRRAPNSNHSHFCEILTDCRLAIEQHDLAARIHLEANVLAVVCSVGAWLATGLGSSGRFIVASDWTILCTARRLGTPRELPIPHEDEFAGKVRRGIGSDARELHWEGSQIVVLGHGPYALESMRTGLEHGATRITFLCRRHGIVCPEAVDFVNYIRPYGESFTHPQGGGTTVVSV